jgi:ABC-type multidrug transport system fused ATPase/permease subunit
MKTAFASTLDAPPGSRCDDPWHVLLWEMLRVMLAHPFLLAAAILPNVVAPAIAPVQAWLTKEVLDEISTGSRRFMLGELLGYAPLAMAIFLGLALLQIAEKLFNRMLDDRLLIDLQRIWFDRRGDGCPGEQVARSLNDCENARKILDLFQKELWVVAIGLPAVVIWQLNLAPDLLPAPFVSTLIPFAAALLFGGPIQRYSLSLLRLIAEIGSAVARGDRADLHREQERLYVKRIRFEFIKQASEAIASFAFWAGLVVVLLFSASGVWQLLPAEMSAAEIGVFLVNLKLMAKPLSEITKVYNKAREGWPAVGRVLRPGAEATQHGA